MREGDRLADGEVDTIGFATPTVAWARFRRRVTGAPHLPYQPVAWVLAGDEPGTARRDAGSRPLAEPPGPAVGGRWNRRVEVHALEATEPAGTDGSSPWRWELTVESAPRLFLELAEESARDLAGAPDPLPTALRWLDGEHLGGTLVSWTAAFGSVDFRFTSYGSIARALARELGVAAPPSPAVPPAPPPWASAGGPAPATAAGTDLDRILDGPDEEPATDSYDPGGRRDPFVDPSTPRFARAARSRSIGPRPTGVPGLLIDELEPDALFAYPGATVAEVRTPQGRHFIRPGDAIYDGDVVAIDPGGTVTFRRIVLDPTALQPFQEVVRKVDPRWIGAPSAPAASADGRAAGDGDPSGRRDPFRPVGGEEDAARRPSSLAQIECDDLTFVEPEALGDLLARAERRAASYRWERSLAERPVGRGGDDRLRRYLDDVAQAAGHDLARRFAGALPKAWPILDPLEPPPAEMFALLGDLELIAGRPLAAVEAYRLAERLDPGYQPLCGRLHGGRLYGAESVPSALADGNPRFYWLTGYLLAWDLGSGAILERHLLPGTPNGFAADRDALRIDFHGAPSIRLAGPRLGARYRVAHSLSGRWAGILGGAYLPSNFFNYTSAGRVAPFAVGPEIDHRLPLTPEELETALRGAAATDPTQPWHRFFLGQALWAQGRRAEAEAEWRMVWRGARWDVPYYELLWMASMHEDFGQPEWADRLYGRALEERRALPRPIATSRWVEREITAGDWLHEGPGQGPERRFLWWRRLREIAGVAPGDAFRAVLWADYWAHRGDRERAREERALVALARSDPPFDLTRASAWLDYALYLAVTAAAALLALLAVLAGRMVRRLRRRPPGADRPRPGKPFRRAARAVLGVFALLLVLQLALSLAVLAASHVAYLRSLPVEPFDIPPDDEARTDAEERPGLTGAGLWRAWLHRGAVEPVRGAHGPLVAAALELRSGGLRAWLVATAMVTAAGFVIALPPGLLLAWGRARRLAARWVPGGAHARAGADFRGALVFGLFVFAVLPLAWLAVARAWGAVPAPGPVSANFFVGAGLEEPLAPPAPGRGGAAHGSSELERLRAASFGRLLEVYPGAELFWPAVLAALALSLAAHVRRLRRGARELRP